MKTVDVQSRDSNTSSRGRSKCNFTFLIMHDYLYHGNQDVSNLSKSQRTRETVIIKFDHAKASKNTKPSFVQSNYTYNDCRRCLLATNRSPAILSVVDSLVEYASASVFGYSSSSLLESLSSPLFEVLERLSPTPFISS